MRVLSLIEVEREALAPAAEFVARAGIAPRDVIDCFCALNAARMLGRMGLAVPGVPEPAAAVLATRRLARGGFARHGGAAEGASAYHTFLAALCYEMLGQAFPDSTEAGAAVSGLKRMGGGFADLRSGAEGQTSATAAAIAYLTLSGAITTPDAAAVEFLCAMQAPDGGFRVCAAAPESDLLSTFTALVTLFALDGLRRVNLGGAMRFVGRLADETGGFRASLSDTEPDIEYTYYGLGALALVRVYVELLKALA